MTWITDANTAVARVAYQLSEVLAVYPITPSTSMAESCEQWASQQKSNLLGDVPNLWKCNRKQAVLRLFMALP